MLGGPFTWATNPRGDIGSSCRGRHGIDMHSLRARQNKSGAAEGTTTYCIALAGRVGGRGGHAVRAGAALFAGLPRTWSLGTRFMTMDCLVTHIMGPDTSSSCIGPLYHGAGYEPAACWWKVPGRTAVGRGTCSLQGCGVVLTDQPSHPNSTPVVGRSHVDRPGVDGPYLWLCWPEGGS